MTVIAVKKTDKEIIVSADSQVSVDGASAEQAVETAKAFDVASSGETQTIKIKL